MAVAVLIYVDSLVQDCSISIANTGDTAVLMCHKTVQYDTVWLTVCALMTKVA